MSAAAASAMPDEATGRPDLEDDSAVKVDFTPCGRCGHGRDRHPKRCAEPSCDCHAWRRSRPTHVDRETMDYLGAATRFIRAAGRRVREGDEPELAGLLALQRVLDEAIADAVDGQKSGGKSWAQIALGTGTTREAAYQRWGKR